MSDKLVFEFPNPNPGSDFLITVNPKEIKEFMERVECYECDEEELAKAAKDKAQEFLSPDFDWTPYFDQINRKKNGTFKVNSMVPVHDMRDFGYDSEDYYGFRYPQLRLKVLSDYEAELQGLWVVDKW